MCFPWALARLLPSALRVRIRSRYTSASPPSTASIQRPVLVPVSSHGSAKDRNCALASTMRLTMANRSKVPRACRSILVTVHDAAGGEAVEREEEPRAGGPQRPEAYSEVSQAVFGPHRPHLFIGCKFTMGAAAFEAR